MLNCTDVLVVLGGGMGVETKLDTLVLRDFD